MKYSRILFLLGRELDSLKPLAYEIVCYGNSYLVRCRVKEDPVDTKAHESKVRKFPAFLRLWREETKPAAPSGEEGAFMNVEFFYGPEEMTRLEEKGQPPEQLPDPYSFSYTLETVGDLLDRKSKAKLLFASNRGQEGQKIVVLHEAEKGGRALEEYPIAGLYDLWVQQYVKKKK